jgi:hypothetical protein
MHSELKVKLRQELVPLTNTCNTSCNTRKIAPAVGDIVKSQPCAMTSISIAGVRPLAPAPEEIAGHPGENMAIMYQSQFVVDECFPTSLLRLFILQKNYSSET